MTRKENTALQGDLDDPKGEYGQKGKGGDRDQRQLQDDARADREFLFQPFRPAGE